MSFHFVVISTCYSFLEDEIMKLCICLMLTASCLLLTNHSTLAQEEQLDGTALENIEEHIRQKRALPLLVRPMVAYLIRKYGKRAAKQIIRAASDMLGGYYGMRRNRYNTRCNNYYNCLGNRKARNRGTWGRITAAAIR